MLPDRFAPNVQPARARLRLRRDLHRCCSSLAGVSGPILDVFFVRSNLDRQQLVATKAAVQMLGHCLKVAYFGQLLASGGESLSPLAILIACFLYLSLARVAREALYLFAVRSLDYHELEASILPFGPASRYVIGAVSTFLFDLRRRGRCCERDVLFQSAEKLSDCNIKTRVRAKPAGPHGGKFQRGDRASCCLRPISCASA